MAVQKANKKIRQVKGRDTEDLGQINNIVYNESSGAFKAISGGPNLIPLNNGSGGFTTNATTARAIPKGTTLAIYNNGTTAQSLTFGDNSGMAALAIGATDVNGNVGCACEPGDWSYYNSYDKTWVRTDSANLIVYIVRDESYITLQG